MMFRALLLLLALLLSEAYTFILVKDIAKGLREPVQKSLVWGYVILTVLTWASFRVIRFSKNEFFSQASVKNTLIAWGMGVLLAKMLVAILLLGDDIRRVIQFAVQKYILPDNGNNGTISPIGRATFIKQLAVVVTGLSVWSLLSGIGNRYRYEVKKITLRLPKLPASFKGLKVIHISDIHTGSFDNPAKVAAGIDRILQQKPDLILFTGDLVNNATHEVSEEYEKIYARLKAPMGVYSTLGNHDYGDYATWETEADKQKNFDAMLALHRRMGWRLLMNEHTILQKGEDSIALIGIENWGAKAHFPKYGDMPKATEGLKNINIPVKILMSHDPSHWDAQVRTEYKDIDLTLSGHTHGMQFGIDSKVFKWSPVQYIYKQWAGLYEADNQYLYVNRGFGFLGYPGRVGILPEITLIELV